MYTYLLQHNKRLHITVSHTKSRCLRCHDNANKQAALDGALRCRFYGWVGDVLENTYIVYSI